MKRKAMAGILLAGVLAIGLCGCGASDSVSREAETAAPETETAAVTEAPEETKAPETVAPETEAPAETTTPVETEAPVPRDETYEVVLQYGFENGRSVLSYQLDTATLQDCGDYYTISATLEKAVEVPADLQDGEQVTVTTNELTGEQTVFTCRDGALYDEGDTEYYLYADGDTAELLWGSDDRMDAPFYEGTLRIRKDAQTGAMIADDIHTLTADDLQYDPWFNGVAFDEEGYVTELIFIGD